MEKKKCFGSPEDGQKVFAKFLSDQKNLNVFHVQASRQLKQEKKQQVGLRREGGVWEEAKVR